MKKIFTVSLVAIMAATAANADIASTKYVTDRTGNTTFTGSIAESADLTVAVNALAGKVDTVAGEGEGSVAEQIEDALTSYTNTEGMNSAISTAVSGAKQELTTEIGEVEAKADANTQAISNLDKTYATDTALTDGLALKQDVANLAKAITEGMDKETTYPSVSLMETQIADKNNDVLQSVADLDATVKANETDIEGKVSALTTTVTNNKSAADTGIQEAKDAATQALTDAKAYADAEDKKIEDQIGTVEQGKTVVQMITEAKEAASGDAGDVAADLEAYISSNNTAVAAAKKAGDDAQADLDAYKTSNDAAVANAQTNAVASAKTYTDGEIDKVEAAYAAADTALETSLKSYADTAEADAIAAAKTAGDAAYAAKSYEGRVQANETAISKIDIAAAQTLSENQGDGQYALTMTKSGDTLTYKWEQIGR